MQHDRTKLRRRVVFLAFVECGALASARTLADECSIASSLPNMVHLEGGSFQMGEAGKDASPRERRQHPVTIKPFWISKCPVTFAQWDACVKDGGCLNYDDTNSAGRKCAADPFEGDHHNRPVINVSFDDANRYAKWLSLKTHQQYRLLSEAEYEFAVRGPPGSTATRYWWGDHPVSSMANIGTGQPTEVGTYPLNGFQLYDIIGNVWEWTEDCWHSNYDGAPDDQEPWVVNCKEDTFIVRGGSWHHDPEDGGGRSAVRVGTNRRTRADTIGFRVGRSLPGSAER